MFYWGRILDRRLKASDFINAFRMAKYAAVYLPSLFFATASVYGSILFAGTGASIASKVYHYNTFQTGLLMGLPLTVGCTLGEASAGWISDLMIDTYAKRHRGYLKPEVRLWLIPLCFPMSIGIIAYGFVMHPYLLRKDITKLCEKHGNHLEAYSPLTRGQKLNAN